ncbi:group II intron maturase-specific domain-containing protein [Streptomyces albicerus]|uniref:group II intron maturase-specific domain-containing protein n=1 Tax=Streptomyces albicerus TaxID=2569859 RepID=UPI0021F170CE|nr:group II intron maturase-specific domain-containing protein [Streptomyces albicerus]
MAHPAPPETRHRPVLRLHLPGQEGPAGHHAKVKTLCRQVGTNQPLDALLARINPAVRGWCAYFRPGVSYATFSYLRNYMWHTVWRWVQRKHPKTGRRKIYRQYCGRRSWWTSENRELFDPITVGTTRYRYRGLVVPLPGAPRDEDHHRGSLGACGEPGAVPSRMPGSGSGSGETGRSKDRNRAPGRLHQQFAGGRQERSRKHWCTADEHVARAAGAG